MRSLLIDDVRDIPADVVCRTFEEGLKALKEGGWHSLYLDHDLGDAKDRTGYDIIKYVEEHPELRPGQVIIVSANPVGVKNISAALRAMGYETRNNKIWYLPICIGA